MLKKRLITAAILVPLVLFAILYAHVFVLIGLLVFVLGLTAYEWQQLIPLVRLQHQVGFVIFLLISALVGFLWFKVVLSLGLLFWGGIILAILTYPASQKIWGRPLIVAFLGGLFLPVLGISAVKLYKKPHGPGLIIYVLALVSVADSGAYFVGNLLGRHTLIPRVSAGKTIEGALGGLLLSMAVAEIGVWIWSPEGLVKWLSLALITVIVSMFGDLSISMFKRRQKLKDTGTLLPGHGGVLDRLDSVLAALPCFYFGYTYLFVGFS